MRKILLSLLLSWVGVASAGGNDVVVDQAWVGESVPGQTSATLELNITTVTAARLLSVNSTAAERVEIHNVSKRGGKMQTRVINELRLPPHRTTTFGSHQLFLVMRGLKKELNIGDRVPVSLVIAYPNKRKQTIAIEATVKKMELSYKHLGSEEVHDHR